MVILRIRELADQKKISQTKLSKMVGVSTVTMSTLMKGETLPRKEVLIKLARSLDVDIKDLFVSTKEEEQKPSDQLKEVSKLIYEISNKIK